MASRTESANHLRIINQRSLLVGGLAFAWALSACSAVGELQPDPVTTTSPAPAPSPSVSQPSREPLETFPTVTKELESMGFAIEGQVVEDSISALGAKANFEITGCDKPVELYIMSGQPSVLWGGEFHTAPPKDERTRQELCQHGDSYGN
jgi:hypothetical protein